MIHTPEHGDVWGANQIWYPSLWHRRAGCGPTVGSHLMWYLSRSRAHLQPLCTVDGSTQAGILQLMEEMWFYITPTRRGVNSTSIFEKGALRYALDRGVSLTAAVLDIPPFHCNRPTISQVTDFLSAALERDLPVAFLNLSNGELINLDNWHWVTLTGVDTDNNTATMVDQCRMLTINLDLWLKTSLFGGGLVALQVNETAPSGIG